MVPPPVVRRSLLDPAVVLVQGAVTLASPLIVALAALASLLDPLRRRPVRLALLVCGYCALELLATTGAAWLWLRSGFGRSLDSPASTRRHYDLVRWFLDRVRALAERTTGFDLRIASESADAQRLLSDCAAPVIVLARHAGAGDSFLIVQELLSRYRRCPRIVMKATLQYDPLVDLFGNRVANCFIEPSGDAAERAIRTLAQDLGNDAALLIFPEGGNFSLERRRRGLARLARAGEGHAARRAMRMHSVVPPRPGGVVSALDAAPDANVVVIAHTGLAEADTPAALWRAVPFRRPARMRLWSIPRAEVPEGEEARAEWLFDWWQRLDDWLETAV